MYARGVSRRSDRHTVVLARRRRSPLRACVAIVALALGSTPAVARAAPRSTHLVYVRAASADQCADERGVRAAVARRLGYDPFVTYAQITIVVEVRAAAAPGYEADIHVVEGDGVEAGTRKLTSAGPGCQEIVDALALSLSIIVDPVGALRAPSPPPTAAQELPAPALPPPPSVESPSSPSVEPPSTPSPAPAAQPALTGRSVAVGLSLFASVAEAPAVSGGLLGFARVRTGAWSLGLEVRADLPASHTVNAAESVESHTVTGWLVPCGHVWRFEGCALVGAGAIFATGSVATPGSDAGFTWGFGGRVGAAFPLGERLFIHSFVDVVVTPDEAHYLLAGSSIYHLEPVGGDLGVGVGVLIP